MEEDSDLSAIRMFMEQFSINDEEASKMNIPSNYNHYAQGDMHKIIQEYSDYTKVLFKEILDTYDWGKNDRSDIKKMILSIIYPEKYLKDQHMSKFYNFLLIYRMLVRWFLTFSGIFSRFPLIFLKEYLEKC